VLTFLLIGTLLSDPYVGLYPYPEIHHKAESYAALGRALMSDEPNLYRLTWSFFIEPPCPDELSLDGSTASGENVPCTAAPALPARPPFTMPAVLFTAYQNLTYTAPDPPDGTKASLQLSWRFTVASAGVVWELTATAAGVQHDVLLCEYQPFRKTIYPTPATPLTVTFLRPKRYHHLKLSHEGFSLEIHDIRQWQLPLTALGHALFFDMRPDLPKCGVPAIRYTTKPAETLQSLMQGLVPDAAIPLPGDVQIVTAPMLGFKDCGEFPYAPFLEFMTHRLPATPSNHSDGPPLELWRFTAPRDRGAGTRLATDSEADAGHSQVAEVQAGLAELGLSGPFTVDPAMQAALDAQAEAEETRFKRSADALAAAGVLFELFAADPSNPLIAETLRRHVLPQLDHLDQSGNTEIEFNPFIHCTRPDAMVGESPLLGRHFWDRPLPICPSCAFHDRILADPFVSFTHSRLLGMSWIWDGLHEGHTDLYRKAHAFIREVLFLYGRNNLADVQEAASRRQAATAHQGQRAPLALDALEDAPSPATPNRATAAGQDDIPLLFQNPYDRCLDPSWTAQYLLRFGEIPNLLAGPCHLLWAVSFH